VIIVYIILGKDNLRNLCANFVAPLLKLLSGLFTVFRLFYYNLKVFFLTFKSILAALSWSTTDNSFSYASPKPWARKNKINQIPNYQ
jgi:hypothetical protein